MRWIVSALIATAACSGAPVVSPPASAPPPTTIEEFRSAVQAVLSDTGVPGAGIALVRESGVEWAGGVGLADRDRGTPVTADTHFRAGSISKTFIAMALVQLSEDDALDLDTPVTAVAPGVRIDNPWDASDPVRVIHLIQHTAGFDDMHFNEMYNVTDPPDIPLADMLQINRRSRQVRWRPGSRASYSNPGFGVAGHVLEFVSGEKYEDFIASRIFEPAGMTTSSFVLTAADEVTLAKGYKDRSGPPVPYSQIYLRPAGNLHTSPADLGKFVHMLLNWGEMGDVLVVDPEYLSNMEHPRASLASDAGLRSGYGSGIASMLGGPFPLLGHNGGIDGFSSVFAYSTSRDIGYVVLLNSTHSPDAMRRISSLAVQYLKAGIEPPEKPQVSVPAATLRAYEGYYHDANPRNQVSAFMEWLLTGRTMVVEGDALYAEPVFGQRQRWLPVSDSLFRQENEVEATRVFTTDDAGTMVFTGGFAYAERTPRWAVELVRWPVLISFFVVLTPIAFLVVWLMHARRATPAGFWWLKGALLMCACSIAAPIGALDMLDATQMGVRNVWTGVIFFGSLMLPVATMLAVLFTIDAWRNEAGRWLRVYGLLVATSAVVLTLYLWSWGMLALRSWDA